MKNSATQDATQHAMLDRLKQFKIGFIPLPIYLVLLVGYIGITILDVVPEKDMLVSLGVMTVFAYLLEEVGAHIPVLKSLGGKVLVVTFLPAFLVYKNWLPTSTVKVVSSFMSNNNFLMFFITLLVVGSIASMNRVTLVKATSRILLILILCDITGSLVGTGVGMLLGMTAYKAYFFIVAPIMAGGVGEGAMPLSIGYAAVMSGMSQDNIFGQILPCVMLGSLVAVLLSGVLAIAIYFLVVWLSSVLKSAVGIQLPAPVILLLVLMGAKMLGYIPKNIETGGASLYGFTVKGVTPSLLFGVGVAKTDWKELIAVFQNPAAILTIIATVFTIVITAFVVSKILGLYPVDTAIAVSCCSGQGGTGALAILAAGDRMTLMPFAQVAVRLGGAMTVTVAIFLMGILS